MKEVLGIKTAESKFIIEQLWSSYIISSINEFLHKIHVPYDKTEHILVKKEKVMDLENALLDSLRKLLLSDYMEPTSKELQKYSTRFEKILIDGKTFRVNYRMNEKGRAIYAIYQLIKFVQDAQQNKKDIIIEGSN